MCGFAFCNFACGFCNKNKFIMLMKKLFIAIMCVFVVTQLYAETGDVSSGRVHFRTVKYNTNAGQSVHRTPYHSAAVTSSYNEASALFTLWFHYAAENAEVLITKDGETIVEETFDMSANELLECDFSECESGEYTIYMAVDGAVQVMEILNVY